MPKRALAVRSGVSIATVNRILSGRETRPSLENIGAIAAALGVVVRVGAELGIEEPVTPVQFAEKQAEEKARKVVKMVQGTMGLEAQGVDARAMADMVNQTKCDLMAGSRRRLWSA